MSRADLDKQPHEVASMFDDAGFRRVLTTDGHSGRLPRLLVRLDLPKR